MTLWARISKIAVLVAALCGFSTTVGAAEIEISFEGTIAWMWDLDSDGLFGLNDPVSGSLIYDTDAEVDVETSEPDGSFIDYDSTAITSFSIQLGDSYVVTGNSAGANSYLHTTHNEFTGGVPTGTLAFRNEASGPMIGPLTPELMQFALNDHSAGGDVIHETLPTAWDWLGYEAVLPFGGNLNFLLFGPPGSTDRVDWVVESITVVPEPGTAVLVSLGLVGIAARARRTG